MTRLLLIPTERERRILLPRLIGFDGDSDRRGDWVVEPVGFGLVSAGVRTAMLLAQTRPQLVVLAGIAGGYHERLSVGQADEFGRVLVDGLGVGTHADNDFRTPQQLGWEQWPGSASTPPVGDAIELASQPSSPLTLLSVAAAAADRREADRRRRRYPEADAEDMEGFAVAMACRLAGVPLRIVRGISNRVGDRELANWQVEPALDAVAERVCRIDRETTANHDFRDAGEHR